MDSFSQSALRCRELILRISSASGEGHVPSSLSVVEAIVASLNYLRDMGSSPANFVLSKGHAALGLFSCLVDLDYISEDELSNYASLGSRYGGHPDSTKSPHIALSSGSLGHGLPFAAGLAHANKIKSDSNPVICLVGDGELNEGSNWEAFILAANLKLDNLICLIDDNKSSERGSSIGNVAEKGRSFGLDVLTLEGHDAGLIYSKEMQMHSLRNGKPKLLVLDTVKGKGIRDMEESPEFWHHRKINQQDLDTLLPGLSG